MWSITINIFYLDNDPNIAAKYMCDKHIKSQINESALMLSTAHRVLDGIQVILEIEDKNKRLRKRKIWVIDDFRNDVFFKVTHYNHPSSLWVRQSVENYIWLAEHLLAIGDEYHKRYGKKHATISRLGYDIQSPPLNLKEWDFTFPPSVMDDQYKISDNPVDNYRNLYLTGKKHLTEWKDGKPYWAI